MATSYHFRITPSVILYPDYAPFEVWLKRKTGGQVWTSEGFTWSCLPGYMLEKAGAVYVATLDRKRNQHTFRLHSRPYVLRDKIANPFYAYFDNVPVDLKVGAGGTGGVHSLGSAVIEGSIPGVEYAQYMDWSLISIC